MLHIKSYTSSFLYGVLLEIENIRNSDLIKKKYKTVVDFILTNIYELTNQLIETKQTTYTISYMNENMSIIDMVTNCNIILYFIQQLENYLNDEKFNSNLVESQIYKMNADIENVRDFLVKKIKITD